MDSKLYGVPLSTTPSPPPPKVPSGIRAPLTTDSDFEFEYSNGKIISSNNSTYTTESEEEGFLSGEEGFETASERPFLADPDDEIVEETHFVNEFPVSRPFVKYPNEENFEKDGNFSGYGDFRPFVTTPDDNFEENSNLGEYDDSRPYLTDQDDDIVEDNFRDDNVRPFVAYRNREAIRVPMEMENEYTSDVDVEAPKAEVGISLLSKQGIIPIAQLSGDLSDDGSVHSVILEDDGCSGVVRIPETESFGRFNGAPRVKVLEVEEEEGIESESEETLELDVVKDSILSAVNKNRALNFENEEEHIVEEDRFQGFELAEVVEDKVLDISEGVDDNSLVKSQENIMQNEMGLDSNAMHSDEDIQAFQSDTRERKSMELDKNIKHTDHANDFGESNDSFSNEEDYGSPSESLERDMPKLKSESTEIEGGISFGTLGDDGNYEKSYINVDGNVVTCQDNDNGEAESRNNRKTDRVVDQAEPSSKLIAQNSAHSMESYSRDISQSHVMAGEFLGEYDIPERVLSDSKVVPETTAEVDDGQNILLDEEEEDDEGSFLNNDAEDLTLKDSDSAVQETERLNEGPAPSSNLLGEISEDNSETDGQVITDSDEEVEVERDDEYQGKEIFDSNALAALLRAATAAGSDNGGVTITTADGNRIRSLQRPTPAESEDDLSEEAKKKLEKLQEIRVNYLRILHKLNRSFEDPIASQVLYRLVLAAGRSSVQAFSLDSAKKLAMELESKRGNDLNFSLNILVIGKTGVGKSATINSIFGEERVTVGAFEPTTTNVKEINGTLNGVKIRILDTPGLRSSLAEQMINRKILSLIKKCIQKFSPHVVLYVDRLDVQTRDINDLPMLKSVTKYLGSSIWRNSIITLTHAAAAPPDGPYGYPTSYEVFVAQRSRVLQQLINHSISDVHMIAPGLMSPVSVVENNPREMMESGANWRSQLMLLCYSTKMLSEIASVVKAEDSLERRKLFGYRARSPPLLYFLTSLLQPIVHPKLSTDQGGENVDSDIELAYSSESDQEDEDEYDQLPPFKPLRKSQIANLSKDQRKAYFEEYDYRVKLLQKKQWKEEVKRVREMKKDKEEEGDQEMGSPESVAVPLPDMVLPPSFDGDNPCYRYRYLEPSSQLLTRPVLDSQGWDHDCGYDGVSIEDNLAIANQFPAVISVQLTKDKKEFNFHLNSSVSAKHRDNGSTMAGVDIQTIGKQLAYILKSEFKARNYRINKTAAGFSVTFLGENVVTGLKVDDHIAIGKRLALTGNTGVSFSQGDAAYGANMEVRLREKDYPIGQDESTLSLSVMRWRGDLMWGCNVESRFSVGRNSKVNFRAGLNNKGSGQISIRTSSSDQLQIAILALIPIVKTIYRNMFLQSSEYDTEHTMSF